MKLHCSLVSVISLKRSLNILLANNELSIELPCNALFFFSSSLMGKCAVGRASKGTFLLTNLNENTYN